MKEQNDRQLPVSDRLFDCLEDFRNRYGGENQVVVVKLGTQPALPACRAARSDIQGSFFLFHECHRIAVFSQRRYKREQIYFSGVAVTLAASLQQAILPGRVLSIHVGFSRTAVLAETGSEVRCGLAATLTNPDYIHRQQPAVRQAGHLHEMDYSELAALFTSASYTEAAIGLAAINALLPTMPDQWEEIKAHDYLIQHHAGQNVAMIGHFPFVERLQPHMSNLWVLELTPRQEDLPAEAAPEILPRADVIAMTATTLINKTFDGLMALCRPDATVVMIGASTPLSPVLYNFGVHVLCGAVVTDPSAALLGISQGISTHQLRNEGYIRQVTVRKAGKH